MAEDMHAYSGLTGIVNCGNTCFLSSVVQVLSNTEGFRDLMMSNANGCPGIVNEANPDSLARPLHELLQQIWSGEYHYANPRSLVTAVKRKNASFQGYQQQDAHDFLLYLLATLDEELQQPTSGPVPLCLSLMDDFRTPTRVVSYQPTVPLPSKHSIVTDLFQGVLVSDIICSACGNKSSRKETFLDLSLEVADSPPQSSYEALTNFFSVIDPRMKRTTVHACLEDFFSQEGMVGENQYHCDQCAFKQDAMKQLRIQQLPEVLCLTLKRFKTVGQAVVKIRTHVKFPATLPIPSYCTAEETERLFADSEYQLFGVVVHEGSANSGHYTAYARSGPDERWYLFNDTEVIEASWAEVEACQAYMLMYRRQSDTARDQISKIFQDNTCTSSEDDLISVSRAWLSLACSTTQPPPVNNWDIMCSHGGIQTDKFANLNSYVVQVNAEAYHRLQQLYGGDDDILRNSPCQVCRAAVLVLNDHRLAEKRHVRALHSTWSIEDQRHCLLPARWFEQWEAYVEASGGNQLPPPSLNNKTLLTNKYTELRPRLIEQRDYFLINPELFQFLQDRYGGGPCIVVEVDPLSLIAITDAVDMELMTAGATEPEGVETKPGMLQEVPEGDMDMQADEATLTS